MGQYISQMTIIFLISMSPFLLQAQWTFPSNGMEYAYGQGTGVDPQSVISSHDRDTQVARQKWAATKQPRASVVTSSAGTIPTSASMGNDELRMEMINLEAEVIRLEAQLVDQAREAFREFRFYSEQLFNTRTQNSADYQLRIYMLKQIIAYASEVKYYPNPNNMANNAMTRLGVSYENLPKYFQDLGREYFVEAGYVKLGSKSCRVASASRPKNRR